MQAANNEWTNRDSSEVLRQVVSCWGQPATQQLVSNGGSSLYPCAFHSSMVLSVTPKEGPLTGCRRSYASQAAQPMDMTPAIQAKRICSQ